MSVVYYFWNGDHYECNTQNIHIDHKAVLTLSTNQKEILTLSTNESPPGSPEHEAEHDPADDPGHGGQGEAPGPQAAHHALHAAS